MIWSIVCLDGPDAARLRAALRAAHSAYLRDADVGMVACGPLTDDDGEPVGSLFIIEADDRAAAERFNREDPFGLAGLWKEVTIHQFEPSKNRYGRRALSTLDTV